MRSWVPLVVLAVLAFAIFGQVYGHTFLLNWDDVAYVVENKTVRGLSWEHLRAAFAAPYYQNYAPLHLTSYMVDYSLWGLHAGAFLVVNVALHAANGAMLFLLLRRFGISAPGSLLGAAIFVAHPVQVESVAWVSERKNLLSMTFALGALHTFVSYRITSGRARWAHYAAAVGLTSAALLTKAAAVVIPPILLLIDACLIAPERRRRWILDKFPFAIASAALALVTILSQGDAVAEGRAVFSMTAGTKLYTMVPVVLRYVGMLFWPFDLSAIYLPKIRQTPDLGFVAATVVLSALGGVGALLWSRDRRAACWVAVFFVALVPVLHIVPLPTLMNDRYLYFPMLGAAGVIATAVDRISSASVAAWRTAAFVSTATVVALSAVSFERTTVWHDDLTLWSDVTDKAPTSTLAWVGLGMAYSDVGRLQDAITAYQRALQLDPFYALALNNLGGAYNVTGRPVEARALLVRAVQVEPQNFNAHMNLGVTCRIMRDFACAAQSFRAAAAIRPGAPEAFAELQRLEVAPVSGR